MAEPARSRTTAVYSLELFPLPCVLAHSPALGTRALPCAAGRDGGPGEGSVEAPCHPWRRESAIPSTPVLTSLSLQQGQTLAKGNASTSNAKASSSETAKALISIIKACSVLPLAVPVESLPQRSDLCESSFFA